MWDADPRQNQKPRVIGDEADVAPPRFRAPADEAVAAGQVARRRTPCQSRDRADLRPHQIFGLFSDRLFIAQVVVVLQQAVEARLFGSASHLCKRQGLDLVETTIERRRVDRDGAREPVSGGRRALRGRVS